MKVVIIGAGVAGLGIGWRLAQQRIETVILERAQPGRGATWASAGMIAAPQASGKSHPSEAQLADSGAELWRSFAAEVEEASRRGIAYLVNGGMLLARTPEETDRLRSMAKSGMGEFLSADSARIKEPRLAASVDAALWNADQGKVDNRALGRALAAAFVRAGGHLQLNEAAVRFEFQGDRIVGVRTPFALQTADAFVLAAGAWSAQIEGLPPDARPPVVPVKGEMLALEPPSGEILPGPSIGGGEIYLVSQRERLLVGATVERVGFDSGLTEKSSEWLCDQAFALIPCLRDWAIAEHWAGLRPGSPDDLPIIGETVVPKLFVASGQYRNGVLYAPAIADAVAAMVTGQPVPEYFAAFDPRRFLAHANPATEYAE
ncbi:MAG TPA: FAD-dependent oxidoreductase [Rhizomicrobium sp.]|nr:FAD-dependent oxidoreductase [Rhizomicrobium sp.]